MMGKRILLLVGASTLVAGLIQARVSAETQSSVSLNGRVTSTEEGPMEGVVVSAKKAGSTITISVVSDAEGRYRFPSAKLDPGPYSLRIRAVGYDLEGPRDVEVPKGTTTTADIKLVPDCSN